MMIRPTTLKPEPRRIAVVKVQRPQQARMGAIRAGMPARGSVISWSPTAPAPPGSSDNWLAGILAAQAYARQTTPGTFTYTPASTTPAPNVAPWNSWTQPNCTGAAPPASPGVDPATSPQPAESAGDSMGNFWKALGLIGGAAATVYLARSVMGQGRR